MASADELGRRHGRPGGQASPCMSDLLRNRVLPHQFADQQVRFEAAAVAAEPAETTEPECAWEAHAQRLRDEEAACNAKERSDDDKTSKDDEGSF